MVLTRCPYFVLTIIVAAVLLPAGDSASAQPVDPRADLPYEKSAEIAALTTELSALFQDGEPNSDELIALSLALSAPCDRLWWLYEQGRQRFAGDPAAAGDLLDSLNTEAFIPLRDRCPEPWEQLQRLTVSPPSPLAVSIHAPRTEVGVGQPVQLTAEATGGAGDYTYDWGQFGSAQSVTIAPEQTSVYSVTVRAGDHAATAQIEIAVFPPPTVRIEPVGPLRITPGQQVTLEAIAEGQDLTYAWDGVAGDREITVSPNADEEYVVTVTDAFEQTATDRRLIQVIAGLRVDITAAPGGRVLAGESITLTAEAGGGAGAYAYKWNSGQLDPSIIVTPSKDERYEVTVIDGENRSASQSIDIDVVPPLVVEPIPAPPPVVPGDAVRLRVTVRGGTGEYEYSWTPGEHPHAAEIAVRPERAAEYSVTVSDGLQSARASVMVDVAAARRELWEELDPAQLSRRIADARPEDLRALDRYQKFILLARGAAQQNVFARTLLGEDIPDWDTPRELISEKLASRNPMPTLVQLLEHQQTLVEKWKAAEGQLAGLERPPIAATFHIAAALFDRALGVDEIDAAAGARDAPFNYASDSDSWAEIAQLLEDAQAWRWAALAHALQAGADPGNQATHLEAAQAVWTKFRQVDADDWSGLDADSSGWLSKDFSPGASTSARLPLSAVFRQPQRDRRDQIVAQLRSTTSANDAFQIIQRAKAADAGVAEEPVASLETLLPSSVTAGYYLLLEVLDTRVAGAERFVGVRILLDKRPGGSARPAFELVRGESFLGLLRSARAGTLIAESRGADKVSDARVLIAPDGLPPDNWAQAEAQLIRDHTVWTSGSDVAYVLYVPTLAVLASEAGAWTLEPTLRTWNRAVACSSTPSAVTFPFRLCQVSKLVPRLPLVDDLQLHMLCPLTRGTIPADLRSVLNQKSGGTTTVPVMPFCVR